jgi:acyl carrier protein
MQRQDIEKAVLEALQIVLKTEVDLSSSRENCAQWDSLKHIEIIFAIEDALGLQFDEAELADLNSVERIVAAVQDHHAA